MTAAARDWWSRAACHGVDSEVFFPISNNQASGQLHRSAQVREAKSYCDRCPVRDACLQDAIAIKDEWAIRGGLTAAERKDSTRAHHRSRKQTTARELAAAISALPPAAWDAIADADSRGHLAPSLATHVKQALLAAGIADQQFSAHQRQPRLRLNRIGLALAQHRPVEVSSR